MGTIVPGGITRKVGQDQSSLNSSKAMVGSITGSNCKSVKEIRSYRANEILHCDLENTYKSRSISVLFELIQGYGGMNDLVNYYVNRCMKSEVIALTNFCIAT